MVVIGGSAGSLEVILHLVTVLPRHSGTAFVIIVHRKHDAESILEELINSRATIPAAEVEDKDLIQPDHIYIAPSDYHLMLEDREHFALDSSEKIHFSRPSIDVTFESIAETYGKDVIGILLSGANADGAMGLKKISAHGGRTIVQDPSSAEVAYMPEQAILSLKETIIANPKEIATILSKL